MSEIYKFPGGYDVTINKRQDIIDKLSDDVDKELISELIDNVEYQAAEYIKQERWAGIPYIGNIRIPKTILAKETEEYKQTLEEAKYTCDKYQYVAVKKRLNYNAYMADKHSRYFNYIASIQAKKHKQLYKHLVETKGAQFANIYMYFSKELNIVETHE